MHAALAMKGRVVAEGLPGPDFARHMLAVDPPDHTRLRRLVSSALSPRTVESLRPRIEGVVDGLLDDLAAGDPYEPVDLVQAFAFPLPFTVICDLLGVPDADRAPLGQGLVAMLVPTPTPADYARAKEASDEVVAGLHRVVEAKRDAPGDDLVSRLIAARDGDERLDDQELLSTIFQLIVAGHDTTTSLIGNGVVDLLTHPEQWRLLREDPARLPDAIEELIRFSAPAPHATFRVTTEPINLQGVEIPAHEQVLICLGAANRDPGVYDDPAVLDINRESRPHLGFGHGIHFCLGAPLARLEARIAFSSLLRRFPDLELAVGRRDLRWTHGDGLVLRSLDELPVRLGQPA
jgi:cytochrome P450